jgi:myo-inositol 2-dehydrogenase / D-chiro-inositol 1-dehydrogenase
MAAFRLGLAGAGRMGQVHLRAISESDRIQVVAVAEPSAANRALLTDPSLAVHSDADAMLKAGGLDGVLVATPSPLHLEMVERIAAAGLPILCEKPCGITAAEARKAAALAAKAGVPLQIGYWRRFVPALKRLKDRIEAGDLGQLYFVTCFQWDERPPAAAFRATSGGIFIDMGVHEFDQLRWLTGQEVSGLRVSVAGVSSEPAVAGDAEAVQILCDLSGGTSALVSLGRRYPAGDVCWAEVFGTKGAEDCRFLWPPEGDAAFRAGMRLQAEGFADAVQGRKSEGATAMDAIAALVAAEQAAAAFRQMQSL